MASNLLKNALRANAIFSALLAADLLFFNQDIAKLMGDFDPKYLVWLGIALIGFAITLLVVSERNRINLSVAKFITLMDVSWVIGSVLLMIIDHHWFSTVGLSLISAVALVVAICALYQLKGTQQQTQNRIHDEQLLGIG